MSISQWLKDYFDIPLVKVRKLRLSNEEWEYVCSKYEEFCSSNDIKPKYR